jgi:hypothetical protein
VVWVFYGVGLAALEVLRQLDCKRATSRQERMCRYLARPPIAQHRLTRREDGRCATR